MEGAGQSIPSDHVMMGSVFKNGGYDTFGCGKWHTGKDSFNRAFDNGEHIYFGGMGDHWNVPCYHYDPTGHYDKTHPMCKNPLKGKELIYRNADHVRSGRTLQRNFS